jgi:glycosyltransferase involved in cell wall biosynthesis
MKVCIVNSFYPPWVGGAETYVTSLAKGLQGAGNQVTVYCASAPLPPGESYDSGVRIRRERAPLRLYGTPIAVSPLNLFREDYDVIHCNFPSPYLSALFSWFGKIRGIPTVLTWHNDLPRVTSAAGVLVRAHDFLSPAYLGYYRRIITTTKVYSETSPVLKRWARKVRVVPNGVDTVRFSPLISGSLIRARHGFNEEVVVLFVGALTRWHAYKGVDYLIRAFRTAHGKNPSLRLLIVGSGSLLPTYQKQAHSLGLGNVVTFAGHVSDEELPQYYAACDLAVLPSRDRSEGFGLVLLEAMACGKPVIGCNVGGISDVVQQGEDGLLVDPERSETLSEAILALAHDDELRKRMGTNGRNHAESHDWSRTIEATIHVYTEATTHEPAHDAR